MGGRIMKGITFDFKVNIKKSRYMMTYPMITARLKATLNNSTIKGLYCDKDRQIEIFLKEIHEYECGVEFEKKLFQVIEHEAIHHAFHKVDNELNSEYNVMAAQKKLDTTIIYGGI